MREEVFADRAALEGILCAVRAGIGRNRLPTVLFGASARGVGDGRPSPVDRRKPGSRHHSVTDATGTPLAVTFTAGNRITPAVTDEASTTAPAWVRSVARKDSFCTDH